jgi:hypothetical protein
VVVILGFEKNGGATMALIDALSGEWYTITKTEPKQKTIKWEKLWDHSSDIAISRCYFLGSFSTKKEKKKTRILCSCIHLF